MLYTSCLPHLDQSRCSHSQSQALSQRPPGRSSFPSPKRDKSHVLFFKVLKFFQVLKVSKVLKLFKVLKVSKVLTPKSLALSLTRALLLLLSPPTRLRARLRIMVVNIIVTMRMIIMLQDYFAAF